MTSFTRAINALKKLHITTVSIGTLTDGGYGESKSFVPTAELRAGIDPAETEINADRRGVYEANRTITLYIDGDPDLSACTGVMADGIVYGIRRVRRGLLGTVIEAEEDKWT